MERFSLSFFGVACLSVVLAACQSGEEPDRAAALGNTGSGTVAPVSGLGGAEPDGGGEMGEATGIVQQYTDDLFNETTPYSSPSNVFVIGSDGVSSETAQYDGDQFTVEGDVVGDRWVLVRPINDSSMFPTLTRQTLGSASAAVPIVAGVTLDAMFATLTTLTNFDESRGHIVIRIVDTNGVGVVGVATTPGSVGADLVAYKSGAVWQDLDDTTNPEGLIFIPNLQTREFPGETIPVILTGSIDAELDVRIARGAVSVVTHVVPP